MNKNLQKGFTLIELLVVIGILAILLAVTLIAINPARQFSQARDTQRRSDVKAILDAINQYSVDEQGGLPGDGVGIPTGDMITATPQNISNTGANLCALLVSRYMAALPTDPASIHEGVSLYPCPATYNTGYTVSRTSNNRVVVSAPLKELAPLIQVVR